MDPTLPMFPLNTVTFPGLTVPLNVFEDRYRALVRHLLEIEDPAERMFGTVAIREGYEVGDHGAQSLFRVGVRLRLTEATERPDGTFGIVAVGVDRFDLERLAPHPEGKFPLGAVLARPELDGGPDGGVGEELLQQARSTFTAYRVALAELQADPWEGRLPQDPSWLSWALAAGAPLPLPDRQELLETDDPAQRLGHVVDLLREELRAMNVIPSLPATEVARTRWSPN
ncbi:LON peptidase substrate-binding domain-containing protein [Nocardioides bruguierae]|uniref:LON peptidase substrate-binding domain-containing protein n=1 Tax=Nocardioides bruguierae TaxID=2945102 RepID=A0A9X2DBM6_9ACTN|nr:LON peptidase substrate-binding domain-containing protein [Nocardioides bruguierae]MCM0621599.1 LON peptidase substrate-binding domain-containing protein [Nocardioides bruguierae]